jgi:bifunctional ADP-heptose synthase (sugar kinase/adenylyltransferase)
MDTRNKIVAPERALTLAQEARAKGALVKVVTGYFDVVFAEHVRRLHEIKDGAAILMVVVLDPPEPVLSGRARAELVAAFGVVDYVVPAAEAAALELLSHFYPGEIVREEPADLLRARRLSEHVQHRQQQ